MTFKEAEEGAIAARIALTESIVGAISRWDGELRNAPRENLLTILERRYRDIATLLAVPDWEEAWAARPRWTDAGRTTMEVE